MISNPSTFLLHRAINLCMRFIFVNEQALYQLPLAAAGLALILNRHNHHLKCFYNVFHVTFGGDMAWLAEIWATFSHLSVLCVLPSKKIWCMDMERNKWAPGLTPFYSAIPYIMCHSYWSMTSPVNHPTFPALPNRRAFLHFEEDKQLITCHRKTSFSSFRAWLKGIRSFGTNASANFGILFSTKDERKVLAAGKPCVARYTSKRSK